MFDIPILIINFNRPKKTRKIISILKNLKPQKLYISIDGPRYNHKLDKVNVNKVKKVFECLNWNCKVKKNFSKKNLGMKLNVINSINWFFKNEKMGIILEDDCIPTISFFLFCKNLLNKYKNEKKIFQINGHNINFPEKKNSYYFSKLNSTWGWATWKRAWVKLDLKMNSYKKLKSTNSLEKFYKNKEISEWMDEYYKKTLNKKDSLWSTYWSFTILKHNGICISPFKSLVNNIGFDGSGNTKRYKSFQITKNIKSRNIKKIVHPKKINYIASYDIFFFNEYIKKVDKRAIKKFLYKLKDIF